MEMHLEWNEISTWLKRSEQIFIKKLSRNDCGWADSAKNGHQNGFLIPRLIAESNFFPALKNSNPEKPHIYDVEYSTFWPASSEIKISTIKYFSLRNPENKDKAKPRYEWQHTGVPKEHFQKLSPASLLLVGKLKQPLSGASHWFIVIDSESEEASIIETYFNLDADFHFDLFDPSMVDARDPFADQLVDELAQAIRDGSLETYIKRQAIPSPRTLATQAQAVWLDENTSDELNPFDIKRPGDAVMRISRDIEYAIFKRAEIRFRAAQVARILLHGGSDPLSNLVRGFPELDSIFLSAAQTRKSRAGLSFEYHVERLFKDGRIRHEAQAILGGRRPDFVLPSVATLNSKTETVIVSLKTTLRERWKQLALEKSFGQIFLATVDDRVSGEAIDEMGRNSIALVVPESLKKAKESAYDGYENVITFRQFFDSEVKERRPSLLLSLEK
ncbi:MAG: type II restriction endonuclease [Stenotrophomonas sp.]|uniref:type II restriction endonuclease n=1 Tax=Stenotrophomonas sp. TaxID=69392 RepID=UPI003D6D82E1